MTKNTSIRKFGERALAWIERIVDRHHTELVKEDVPRGFRSHVLVLRLTGLWPVKNDSLWYKWLTVAFILLLGIFPSLLLFVTLRYANSVEEAMDRSFIGVTCLMDAVKACTIYWQRERIRGLFRIHIRLSRNSARHAANSDRYAQMNFNIHTAMSIIYYSTYSMIVAQNVVAKPEDRIFLSSLPLPYEFAKNPVIYWTVLMYQIVSVGGLVVWVAMADSFYIALMNMNCGHLAELKKCLLDLCTRPTGKFNRDLRFYIDLIDCCKIYENCLRYVSMRSLTQCSELILFGL